MNEILLAYGGASIVGVILVWMAIRNFRSGYRSRPEDFVPPPSNVYPNSSQAKRGAPEELPAPDRSGVSR